MPTVVPSAAHAVDDPAAVHRRLLVIDTHVDTPLRFVDEGWDLAAPRGPGHLDLATARAGNLGAVFFALFVDADAHAGRYEARANALIDGVLEQVRRHPDDLVLATSADEIVAARRGPHPRLAALMGLEGGHAIDNDLGVLEGFYRRGVRYMTLTHAKSNDWAGSSGDAAGKPARGLTPFGVQVVQTMNRLGMMVDVSHVSDATFADVLRVTRAPVVASHSSSRALCDVPRNMTDEMLRAVAQGGGVVQVNFFSAFIDPAYATAFMANEARLREAHASLVATLAGSSPEERALAERRFDLVEGDRFPRPPLSRLIDHIDHIAQVAGVEHVGIGSDFDGIPSTPAGINSAADLPEITAALLARGYGEGDLEKIMGGNVLRVMREVERVAGPQPPS